MQTTRLINGRKYRPSIFTADVRYFSYGTSQNVSHRTISKSSFSTSIFCNIKVVKKHWEFIWKIDFMQNKKKVLKKVRLKRRGIALTYKAHDVIKKFWEKMKLLISGGFYRCFWHVHFLSSVLMDFDVFFSHKSKKLALVKIEWVLLCFQWHTKTKFQKNHEKKSTEISPASILYIISTVRLERLYESFPLRLYYS